MKRVREFPSLPMSPNIIIQEGALFIADAHESSSRTNFLDFLEEIAQNPPPQLFLMGDMFDLLVGGIDYGTQKYKAYIERIDALAKYSEVVYLEGNHDFNLGSLFLHVKVIPIEKQPIVGIFPEGKQCLLSHGDKYGGTVHTLYTSWIRNRIVLRFLGFIDKQCNNVISRTIESNQLKKKLCFPIHTFQALIEEKLKHYPLQNIDYVAEGHYHQNKSFTCKGITYINFSSFACNQSYFTVQSSQKIEFVQKQLRGCNG